MRLSVNQDDSGYGPDAFGAKVFLDGVELKNCVTADEELGEVVILALDSEGYPYTDGKNFVHEVRRGVVKIEFNS